MNASEIRSIVIGTADRISGEPKMGYAFLSGYLQSMLIEALSMLPEKEQKILLNEIKRGYHND